MGSILSVLRMGSVGYSEKSPDTLNLLLHLHLYTMHHLSPSEPS